MTSEKKAKKLLGREKKLLGVRRVRAFAPSFSLSFSQLREEKRVMVSQSISVFFLLKNQEAFFRNEGRPLEREKSPLHTRRTNLLTERNKGVLGKKEKKRKVQLNFNSSRQ